MRTEKKADAERDTEERQDRQKAERQDIAKETKKDCEGINDTKPEVSTR
jgi:hypothetical protein